MLRSVAIAAVACLAATPSYAQGEPWQVTLDNQEYVWDIRLVRLEDDSLVVNQADTLRRLPVGRITEIRLIRKSEVRLGDGEGAGAMSALTGGDDEVYDLTPLEFADRLRAVQKIFLYHPPEP
jgi:hypothetical protein